MGKLGVGIGEDFPVDDAKSAAEGASGTAGDQHGQDDEARREERRRRHEAWHEKKRQWREEWRGRRNAFREEMRAKYGDDYADCGEHRFWHGHVFGPRSLFRIALFIGLIALTIFVFHHLFFILFTFLVLAGLFAAYRGGFDHFDLMSAHGPHPQPPQPPAEAPKA